MIHTVLRTPDGSCSVGGIEQIADWRDAPEARLWVDVEGEMSPEVETLLEELGCNRLSISDAKRSRHPPKIEVFEDNTFILFRGIAQLEEDLALAPQQLGIWVSSRLVVSTHRGHSVSVSSFLSDPELVEWLARPAVLVLKLLHYSSGRYLERLLDFEETLAEMEEGLLSSHSEEQMKDLVTYRSHLRRLRRVFSYHRTVAETIWQEGTEHLGLNEDDNAHLRRNLYDRCERLYSLSGMYYEICGDLVEGHISLSSHMLNNTMKILTIISAIFVPLTFMAGIYGMNFEHMPELGWRYAYFALLALMVCIATTLFVVFRRIKWL
ncbi:MAG: magnesium transporter CorA family protein [Halioglobus sp.]|nr:magnesium transporter CorA family protein [Halioglobus sp.]